MNARELKAGSKFFFGAPANPMPDVIVDAISQVVAQVPGILEAHLPQCFIEGDTEARQILVIVTQEKAQIPNIANQLMEKLQLALPTGQFIDILPFIPQSLPAGIREAGCQIFAMQRQAWWKVW